MNSEVTPFAFRPCLSSEEETSCLFRPQCPCVCHTKAKVCAARRGSARDQSSGPLTTKQEGKAQRIKETKERFKR